MKLHLVMLITAMGIVAGASNALSQQISKADLRSYATMERNALVQALGDQSARRAQFQSDLIEALRSASTDKQKIPCIYLMGRYRMDGVCEDLVAIIDLRDPDARKDFSSLPLWGEYPAAEALAKIGSPAVPFLLANIAQSDSETKRTQSARVLRVILTPGPAKTALQERVTQSRRTGDEVAAKRLEEAIRWIDSSIPPQPK